MLDAVWKVEETGSGMNEYTVPFRSPDLGPELVFKGEIH